MLSFFEQKVIAFALNELSLGELEAWVYENADQLKQEAGPDAQLALLEADYSVDASVVDALNPWFRKRFPNAFGGLDLRGLRGSHMNKQFKEYVRKSLV